MIEKLSYDYDTMSQVDNLTEKLNEVIEELNELKQMIEASSL
jgi:hypothetical protein